MRYLCVLVAALLLGCAPTPPTEPPTAEASPAEPTSTEPPTAEPTPTEAPSTASVTPTYEPRFLSFTFTAEYGDVLFLRRNVEADYVELWAVDVAGGEPRHIVNVQPERSAGPGALSTDGRYYAISHRDTGVLIDLFTGIWAATDLPDAADTVHSYFWADDETVYYIRDDDGQHAYMRNEVPNGVPEVTFETPTKATYAPRHLTENGRYLVYANLGEPRIGAMVWDRVSNVVNPDLRDPETGERVVVWDVRENEVLYSYSEGSAGLFTATLSGGGELLNSRRLSSQVCTLAFFAPEGQGVLCTSVDHGLSIILIEPGDEVRTLLENDYALPADRRTPFIDANRFFVLAPGEGDPVIYIATLDGSAAPVRLAEGTSPVLMGGVP